MTLAVLGIDVDPSLVLFLDRGMPERIIDSK